ncbi:MAG: prenyltransferase [Methanomassiliicoccales archaeon]|nr:prenyltransferase [Methanomassiliicoccales archaeon]
MVGRHDGRAWQLLRLSRLHFLVPGLLLYMLGALLASARGYELSLDKLLFGYSVFFLAHLSVSFSNDYFDREADAMNDHTPLSGGSGVLVAHPELAPVSLTIALALLSCSAVVAVAFAWTYGYGATFLAFAILGGWMGWFYSAPPMRFAYRGLGELTTMLAAGLIMPGMGYLVIAGTIDGWFLLLSLPLMCYGLFFILTVEMPDLEADARSGKRGFLVRYGRRKADWVSLVACLLGLSLFLLFLFSVNALLALGII